MKLVHALYMAAKRSGVNAPAARRRGRPGDPGPPDPRKARSDGGRNPPLDGKEKAGYGFRLRSASYGGQVACNPPAEFGATLSWTTMDRSISKIKRHALDLWNFHHVFDPIRNVDAMVCLGSYDLRVARRCAELLSRNICQTAVVTGGFGNWTAGKFDRPEAEVFADEIISHGVHPDRLVLERSAANIGENIRNSKAIFGLGQIRTVIFITKPQTQLRVKATVSKQWPDITSLVTAPELSFSEQAEGSGSEENLINEMVGDVERILLYPVKGFQIEVRVPGRIIDAYKQLKAWGYDKHCIAGTPPV